MAKFTANNARIIGLHVAGLGNKTIADRLGTHPSGVSQVLRCNRRTALYVAERKRQLRLLREYPQTLDKVLAGEAYESPTIADLDEWIMPNLLAEKPTDV